MSNCRNLPMGAGGGPPSGIACSVSSPDRSSAPAAVTRGSCQVTVRDPGSPHASGGANSEGPSPVIVVLFRGHAGQRTAGGGEHPLDAGGVHRFTAAAADPVGVD